MWAEAFEVKYKGKDKNFGRAEFNKIIGHCVAVDFVPNLAQNRLMPTLKLK